MAKVNRDDIDKFHEYSLYIPTRTLYMGSELFSGDENFAESGTEAAMAARQIKNLHILDRLNNDPIIIIMNNVGGDPNHGMAIYDAIKNCESHVTIKVYGHAMSMGSIIFQAADLRVMSPNSRQMIHYGEASTDGHSKTVQKIAEEDRKFDEFMEQLYLDKIREKHPNYTLYKLQKLLDHDTFLTAKESVELGLADEVDE